MDMEILGQTAGVGEYFAIWKVLIFLIFFGIWAWVGQWLDKDTEKVHTNRALWNNTYIGVWVGTAALFWILPMPFLVNLAIFAVSWLTLSIIYVMHRNARVSRELKILTIDHIRDLMQSKKETEKTIKKRILFISAHGNELPMPRRQEPEYSGYVIAEEVVNELWTRRVSYMEMMPTGDNFQVRYVIDGVVSNPGDRDRRGGEDFIKYIKEMSGLNLEERRQPQNGRFKSHRETEEAQWKVRTAGSTQGEQVILERVQAAQAFKLDELGFTERQLERVKEMVAAPAGVVLICGTKGNGVTTTLYSLTQRHDPFMLHIHTFEKKLLTELDNITQHLMDQSPEAKGAARQLQSVLRGDPDVTMVGFCEEVKMAVYGSRAVTEGKKLYFGVAEPTTFHGLQSWIKWVGDYELVARTLLAIISQKLVRKLCLECREAYEPDAALMKKLNLPADKIEQFYRAGEIEYDKRGRPMLCTHCQGTGYVGRTAVFETLFVSEALRRLIMEKAPINAMRAQCRKEKMLYFQEEALQKVIAGVTSIQEVLRVTAETAAKGEKRAGAGRQEQKDKG